MTASHARSSALGMAATLAIALGGCDNPKELARIDALIAGNAFPVTLTQIELTCSQRNTDIPACIRLNVAAREAATEAWAKASVEARKVCYTRDVYHHPAGIMNGALYINECFQKAGLLPVR